YFQTALGSLYEEGEDNTPEAETPKNPPEKGADMPRVSMMDSDSSDEEGQAFYAGGSEHSGQQVIGPSKKKKDVVSMLFKSAKEHGAEVLEARDKTSGKKKLTFAGTGYRLGETDDDHEVVSGPSKKEEQPKDVTLRMWKTGFTVDGGSLREYDDPSNQEFLNSVRRGQVPMELVRSARGGEVYINMEDHRHEDYVQGRTARKAFTGVGQALGSPAPSVLGQVTDTGMPGGSSGRTTFGASPSGDSTPAAAVASKENTASLENKAKEQLNVDNAKPLTNLQLRLPDGSRLVLKLNHSHTVGDIRRYASTVRPQLPASFALMTTFPYEELTDDSKTISDAKLLNSALVLK
ncbi:UNVERIFIED_CONTAM: hypothetical protein GTU68_036176, partial [Idotea baltica]|nr:hypothetical protein [Idotea baltica]